MKTAAIIVAIIAGVLLLGVATSWFGLVTQRPMAKYAKETDRQVYMNSVAHQQGADSGVGLACGNMRNVSISEGERHSYASIVLSTAAGYGGNANLSQESESCIQEAKMLLAEPLTK